MRVMLKENSVMKIIFEIEILESQNMQKKYNFITFSVFS